MDDSDVATADVDVLVVGAGPTGLTLAAELATYGLRFRLVDRGLDRAHESRALAVQPRTLEVLDPVGVTDDLIARGNRAVQVRMHVGRRVIPIGLFDIGVDDTAYPYLLFVSQAETEHVLGEHLAQQGVIVERGMKLVHMRQNGRGVACVLRSHDGREERVTARYVAGCDGAHSTVRDLAGIPFEGSSYPQTFVLADVEADGIQPGAAHVFLSDRGMLFFFPLGSPATWRVLAMRPRSDTTPVQQPVTLDDVQALVDAYTGSVHVRDPVWMTNFRIHHRGATRYRAERVFLAGDAAHIHSPAGAQGMNTGIQDAVNLGWKLAQVTAGTAPPDLLDTYQLERLPIGRTVLRFTDRAFTIATSTNPLIRFARTRIAPRLIPVSLWSSLGRRYGFRTISQLAIEYRTSPLSVNASGRPGRGPGAGDRMPDGPVIHNGKPSTLHRVLAPPGWHLLLCGPHWPAHGASLTGIGRDALTVHRLNGADDTARDVSDPAGTVLQRLGLRRPEHAQLLVRPDGHIGFRSAGTDLHRLRGYLKRWLGAASAPGASG
jgi:2-polyprenyl-6-methoxyphenol hydroxylase-like FAD-dependent oxidoreductase